MTKLSKNCFMMLWTPISSGAKSFPISFAEIELSMCGWRSPRIVAKNWFTSRSCSTISGASFINGRSLWCSSTRSSHRSCRGNHVIARGKSETYVDLNWLWSKVVDLNLFRVERRGSSLITSPNSPNFNISKLPSPNSPNFNIPKLTSPNSPNLYSFFSKSESSRSSLRAKRDTLYSIGVQSLVVMPSKLWRFEWSERGIWSWVS